MKTWLDIDKSAGWNESLREFAKRATRVSDRHWWGGSSPTRELWDVVFSRFMVNDLIEEIVRLRARVSELLQTTNRYQERYRAAEARVRDLEGSVAHLKQSLEEQAAARIDLTMPLLTDEVLGGLEDSAEAAYALADSREERVEAHGLSLLVTWQRAAKAQKAES